MVLSKTQLVQCVESLKQLEPGFLPFEIFAEVARLVRLPIIVLIPTKQENGEDYIGFLPRAKNDLWWPGVWHLPGTVFRSSDSLESAIQRLLQEEMNVSVAAEPVFTTISAHQTERGAELVLVYRVSDCVLNDTSEIEWFPVSGLPEKVIESEQAMLKAVFLTSRFL